MIGKASSDSPRAAFGAPRAAAAVTGGGHPLRSARATAAAPRSPAAPSNPPAARPVPPQTPPASRRAHATDDAASVGAARQSIGRLIFGWVVLTFFCGIVVLAIGAFVVPESWLWAGTPTEEVSGRVTVVELESKRRRGRATWVLGRQHRIFVKLAPYSFGFVVPCPGEQGCEEQARLLRPGQQVTLTVDKGAFDELKQKNFKVDPASRDINRISQQMIAIEMDRRTVPMLRLVRNGELILGSN